MCCLRVDGVKDGRLACFLGGEGEVWSLVMILSIALCRSRGGGGGVDFVEGQRIMIMSY